MFTSADTHWNVNNMIYGDNNTGVPSIAAMMQSGNLYVYCMSNPVNLWDPFGNDISEDAIILSKDDYLRVQVLTKLWVIANGVGDTATKDKAHKLAAMIRKKDEYRGSYSNSDEDDYYIDDYGYASNYSSIDVSDIKITIKHINNEWNSLMNSGVNWDFIGTAIEHFGGDNPYTQTIGMAIGQIPQGPQYSVGDSIVTITAINVNTGVYHNVGFMGMYAYTKGNYMHYRKEYYIAGRYMLPV